MLKALKKIEKMIEDDFQPLSIGNKLEGYVIKEDEFNQFLASLAIVTRYAQDIQDQIDKAGKEDTLLKEAAKQIIKKWSNEL